ncbi:MAG: non-ribosomal peptide synthetase, partial [Alteromonadaceae bacterium]|nr:non-ribosomal peptide synthetase [Alteromonadaceae bacterium]
MENNNIKDQILSLIDKGVSFDYSDDKLLVKGNVKGLNDEDKAFVTTNKKRILAYIKKESRELPLIVKQNNRKEIPLSFAQQRLWMLDKIDGGSAHYNMPGGLKLSGQLDIVAVEKALTTIVERHEALRTCFGENNDSQAIQIIQSASLFDVLHSDLLTLESEARESALNDIITREYDGVFDLCWDIMLRAHLVQLAEQEFVLLVTMHHIASDGWSMSILINEFSTLYTAYAQGDEEPLLPLHIQYADYACWQRDWLQGEVLDEQIGYWTTQLANLPMVHNLPLDYVRPEIQTFVGDDYFSHIKPEVSKPLKALCQSGDATLFMGIHAAFSALLSHYSNETDIVMGTPIANREQEEVANLIGFFVNTLVLRSDLSDNPSFNALLQQSKDMLLEAYAHQQVPFEQIVEQLQPERSLRHSPLFQVMLILQNNEEGELSLPGISLEAVGQASTVAKYDLTLNVTESDEGLMLVWQYNIDLFNALTIQRLADSFERLLDALVTTPENKVLTAELLSADEIHQQLVQYNDTAKDNEKDECIHDLFEAQVEKDPDAIALVFEDEQLTYGELNARANQL